LSAVVQGQFMFVLPWMLLARGSSPEVAAHARLRLRHRPRAHRGGHDGVGARIPSIAGRRVAPARRRRPDDREAPPAARRLGRDLRRRPHPRGYGTAPRFLGRFAIREGLLRVEEAVARLTARAADRLGLGDRGRVEPGRRADLVLLDPGSYVDTATYADPCRAPDGVVGVCVNGARAWKDGAPTGARAGGVVR
jgi:hypothetical protein